MNIRSASIWVVGFLMRAFLVACGTKREPEVVPTVHAQASEGSASAPPGIKKNVKLDFVMVANTPYFALVHETPVVEEVKGNWVLLRFPCKADAAQNAGVQSISRWVNFANVTYYDVK